MEIQKTQSQIAFTPEKIELIKRTVAEHATDNELEMFMHLANKYQLDPFAKEIWFIKYKATDKPQIFTSRDGYLKIAHASGVFDGIESYTIDDEKGNPVKAVSMVYRKDMTRPFKYEIKVSEYKSQSPTWGKYPSAMAIKVAEVGALKRAFSISGLVTQEELATEPQVTDAKEPVWIEKATLAVKKASNDDEPWNAPPQGKTISQAQQKRLFTLAKAETNTDGLGYPLPRWTEEQLKDLLHNIGYSSTSEIQVSDYERICEAVTSHPGHFTDSPDQVKTFKGGQ